MKVNVPNAILVCICTCVLSAALSFGQDQTPASELPTSITIRLINGKNGKPISDETPNVWVGATLLWPIRVDSHGEIRISIDTESTVSFFGNHYRDCRYKPASGNVIQVKDLKYPTSEIVEKGIVTKNFCGTPSAALTRGVLVIYLRPLTFSEKMAL